MPTCFACLSAHVSSVLTCSRTLRAHMPTCFTCLRAHEPTCFACIRADEPACLACLRVHVSTYLACFCPHLIASQNRELENGMREMKRIGVGMQGMEWECGCGESARECGESG